jgi:outer membrane murein-binding lipoprotein Lpp
MTTSRWTRRRFLGHATLAGAGLLAGCGGNAQKAALREKARHLGATLDCSDITGLQPAEAATREENQYRQHTDRDDQFCLGCLNFQPPAVETACGTCKTVRGPINPDGWCKQWTKPRG